MRIFRIAAACGLLAFAVASMPAAAQDKATIAKQNEAFTSAFSRGDYGAVAGMYTEDAFLLPAGGDMIRGRAGIQAFWIKTGETLSEIRLTTLDVTALGPSWAREIGTFALKTKASPPAEVVGKYVVIWQKVGDDWKLATDIWNMNR